METKHTLVKLAAMASVARTAALETNIIKPETYSPFYKSEKVTRYGNNKPDNTAKNRLKEKLASKVRRKQRKNKK